MQDRTNPKIGIIGIGKFLQRLCNYLALFVIVAIGPTPIAHALQFQNFSSTLTLNPLPDGFYSLAGIKVKTTARIVIKAAPGVGKKDLQKIDSRAVEITELYLLDSGSYFAVSFSDHTILEQILAQYHSSPLVLTAQPDLLQVHDKAESIFRYRDPDEYINKLGIDSLWKETKGKGIKVAIIDDGFDLTHEDLQGVTLTFGYDLESNTLDPSPRIDLDTHGTKVAGIIFAQHNAIGIDGIAPEAELIAIRHSDTWTSRTILSFYLSKIAGADIVNCSWKSRYLLEPMAEVINDLASHGRGGKGCVVVFAAGNEGQRLAAKSSEAALASVITVGASGERGIPQRSSNFGSFVDVYTLGHNIPTTSTGVLKYTPFSGTSASTAIVSGVSALLLSKDPDMAIKDVRKEIISFFNRGNL